jgi:2-polyprenyl-3-methyl-5-hydroxy-6-metoxy-1,4-benzoquinol methylase
VDQPSFHQETHDFWNQNAAFWDKFTGEGTSWHIELIDPAVDRLLKLQPGEQVLDVACGNGNFARRAAQMGAYVTACDFSEVFLERAKARTTGHAERIDYRLIDATNQEQLLSLGTRRFDAAYCGMALQDMPSIDPLLSALSQLLKSDGRFVFSVMHPCFNAAGVKMMIEEEDREGEITTVYSVKVSRYLGFSPRKGLGIIGQPTPQYYFDRPLSILFTACFRAGLVLTGLEEPAFAEAHRSSSPLGWSGKFKEIPPVLVARCVLSSSSGEQ